MKSITAKLVAMTVLALVATSGVAEDSYLYWMVENAHYQDDTPVSFDYATISGIEGDSSTYLSLYRGETDYGYFAGSSGSDPYSFSAPYSAKIPDGQNYESFMIELWTGLPNDAHSQVGVASYSRSTLEAYMLHQATQPFGSYLLVSAVTPEPTSGLMLLLGLAALGLRRKASRNLETLEA